MKANHLFIWTTLIGLLLYNLLFWRQTWGINIPLFSLFILGSHHYYYPEECRKSGYRWSALSTLLLSIAVLISNSFFAKLCFSFSIMTTAGFLMPHHYRFPIYAVFNFFKKTLHLPISALGSFKGLEKYFPSGRAAGKLLRVSLVPVLIVGFFFLLYSSANPTFNALVNDLVEQVSDLLYKLVGFDRLLFSAFGLLLILLLSWKQKLPFRLRPKWRHEDNLDREFLKFKSTFRVKIPESIMQLKDEFKTAMICLAMLNILLFVVNGIDIGTVWFDGTAETAPVMRMRVHYGTYVLIFSIVLAMAVLLYYFRGNLNFLETNKSLKLLAYGWILQNCVLSVTLLIINSRYIYFHGLAYKRLGVIFFLALVAFGLFTVFVKIRNTKTIFYLLRKNAWAFMLLAVTVSFVNWDYQISRYNLSIADRAGVDWYFLIDEVSAKNLPLLRQAIDEGKVLAGKNEAFQQGIRSRVDYKTERFLSSIEAKGIWSWNLADHQVYRNLEESDYIVR